MDYVDVKYINQISSRLQKFKKVKNNLYNFRCPICGDSQKHKNKARGYLYQVKNNTNYKCHNCGISISFSSFLKELDGPLHKAYSFEKFKEGHTGKNFVVPEPEDVFKTLDKKPVFKKKMIDLPSAYNVQKSKMYLHKRAIFEGEFYYAENFKEFVNTLVPGTFEDTKYGEERIVIPLTYEKRLIGFQGRALSSNPIKYLTIMLEEDAPKIYGLDKIDDSRPLYVVEGPFDSTFLENSIAMCGSDPGGGSFDRSDCVWVFDNEPRNREIVSRIQGCIDRGEKVVIWPTNLVEKDLNDMVLAGHNVKKLVESNTYHGLEAKLKFTTWKKI